jgi:hypothetical protein
MNCYLLLKWTRAPVAIFRKLIWSKILLIYFPYFQLKFICMALQVGLSKFTGRLDNVIGYRRNGKYFFRSMPDKVRQTSATRRAAYRFGMASRTGKLIRQALRPYLDMRYDGTLVNRLNKLLVQSGIHNLQALEHFHFNRHTGTEKFFVLPPVFTANGTLTIPAQELPEQGKNTHLEVSLIATRIDFATRRVLHTQEDTQIIDLRAPFNGLQLNIPAEGNGVLFVVLQCRACAEQKGILYRSGDRRYMAADVMSVVVPAPAPSAIAKANGSSIPVIAGSSGAGRIRLRSNLRRPVFTPRRE